MTKHAATILLLTEAFLASRQQPFFAYYAQYSNCWLFAIGNLHKLSTSFDLSFRFKEIPLVLKMEQ